MTHEPQSAQSGDRLRTPRRGFALNIRIKIILPFLMVTLAVAALGIYVFTYLATSSLSERMNIHLFEAGNTVSDTLVNHDRGHIDVLRDVALTMGLSQALAAGDGETVDSLVGSRLVTLRIDCLILVDANGDEILNLVKENNEIVPMFTGEQIAELSIVQNLLDANDPYSFPQRGFGVHPADGRYYYFTAAPIRLNDQMAGVAMVGTRLDRLMEQFKKLAMANVIIYVPGGQILAETLTIDEEAPDAALLLESLAISSEEFTRQTNEIETTFGEEVTIRGRSYRIARGALVVGSDILGVFGVVLPAESIVEAREAGRIVYLIIFAIAAVSVIMIGYVVSQRITAPLARLVSASRAVAEGKLDQRTGIRGTDEIGILAATFDEMTERLEQRTQELEQLLYTYKEASGRMQAILLSIGDGVVLEDSEGGFEPLNPAASAVLDRMSKEMRDDVLHQRPTASGLPASVDDTGPWLEDRRRFQVDRQIFDVHSGPVRTDDGQYLGKVIVLRDVTVETEAERLKDAFVSHVSHELRTPLTVIKGYSSLLIAQAATALGGAQREFVESIDRNTDDLISMVEELLEFSDMEARGHLVIRPQPGEIGPLIEEVAERWQAQMAEKNLTLQVEIPDHLPHANVDLRRMRWAVVALMRNAWQYTPDGGTITMRVVANDGQLRVDISDTGSGIRPEEMQLLFTRFYRSSQEVDNIRGLGLGLYLTRAIVEAHAGKMQVDSEHGAGSTFSIILPTLPPDSVPNERV